VRCGWPRRCARTATLPQNQPYQLKLCGNSAGQTSWFPSAAMGQSVRSAAFAERMSRVHYVGLKGRRPFQAGN
jgi:hypothetical protein